MNNIEVINDTDDLLPEDLIIGFLETLLNHFKISNWDLPVSFVDSQRIRELNRDYRGKDYPTDVITFNAFEEGMIPDLDEVSPGDIVISLNEIRSNASEHKVNINDELARVLIHSVLHLLGKEHHSYSFTEDPMLIEQEEILAGMKSKGAYKWDF